MFRFIAVRRDAARPCAPRRPAMWWVVGLSALVPVVLAVAEVTSLTVSPIDIPAGGSAAGTVRVSGLSSGFAMVSLDNSNPSVLTVPAKVSVGARRGIGSFSVAAVAGAAGCGTISARVGTTPAKSTVVFVKPPPAPAEAPLRLVVPGQMVGTPTTATGTVSLVLPAQQPAPSGVVQLKSGNPIVQVPSSVTVELRVNEMGVYTGQTSFLIKLTTTVATSTCTVITATTAGQQGGGLIKIVPLVAG